MILREEKHHHYLRPLTRTRRLTAAEKAKAIKRRRKDYATLSPNEKRAEDKRLGIID